ncbi:MAG TPA: 16S rRNA (cytosine(967)-C(5))-methyltransferase RsmB [Patescibacteria group bacterium]|nr:16S rRNA (cytosine(967)-C(5))-methyltransferase RsmB [Patescibacteria group bacterium]
MIDLAESDPRRIAFTILRRVEQEGAYSSVLLQHMDAGELEPRDLALITELVYGVLRRQMYLDHVIASFSTRPLERIDPDLRLTLRLALYQVLFLTRIPPHAAVNEAVNMARTRAGHRADAAAAFVNGLLRTVVRERSRVPPQRLPRQGDDPAAALAVAESHPEWLVRRWLERFGFEETSRLLIAQNRPAPMAMRVTRRASSRQSVAAALQAESIATRPSRWLDDFLIAVDGAPQRTPSFRRGDLYIQDEASGLVARLADAGPGCRILDACAAPGGKALYLAEQAGPEGLVVAGDLHPSRLRMLRENIERLGLTWCLPVAADFADHEAPLRTGVTFDLVFLDAPCSGTGVTRRNPELRYRVSPESLDRLAQVQTSLLDRCACLVRPGGALVYSVCSLEPEEGVQQVSRFLDGHQQFSLEDPRLLMPETARVLAVEGQQVVVTLPHRDDLDGFFAARLVRQR